MGMNAREVVRVFACSAQLSYNLSKEKYMLMAEPFRATALSLQSEMDQMKDALKFVCWNTVLNPKTILKKSITRS